MHIPQEYGQFAEPTMIVATDSQQARLFLARQNLVEEVGVVESHYPPKDDMERTSGQSPSGDHFAEQNESTKTISREKLYQALSEELMNRFHRQEFSSLILAAPEEHLNELRDSLHLDLIKRTQAFIPKLLTSEDLLDIIIHAQDALAEN
ncbi:host attachment family protein [Patescibacteria group bacterium]|nr:host attachment family protein [Patescibacteria group bacterium]MBU1705495.1 host attachment family protein [Patescibacteria group bacterium]